MFHFKITIVGDFIFEKVKSSSVDCVQRGLMCHQAKFCCNNLNCCIKMVLSAILDFSSSKF